MPETTRTTQATPQTPAPAPATAARTPAPAPATLRQSALPAVALGGSVPMPAGVRAPIERSLGTDMSGVRIHTSAAAERAAQSLSARAFASGPNIVLGPGERANDLAVIAHEAAHVVQQRGAPAVQRLAAGQSDPLESEAHAAAAAVVRGEAFAVHGHTGGERVQRLGLGDALNYFADKANLIPGFRMFTIILGVNPINMSRVERSAANIMRAVVEFIPGGGLITQALDNYGIFDKVGAWVEQQIATLGMTGSMIKDAITKFLDTLSWSDIFDLGGVWERAKRIFTAPIDQIISFAKGLITGILTFIKDAILMPLAKLAEGTRGWDLLIAVLGKNPITGEAVPRTAETLVGGFMKLIGQEEVWENIKKANAIARVWAWFQGAISALLGFVSQIPTLAINTFKSLELADIVLLPRAFAKVAAVFGDFIGNFISWAGNAVWNLLEIMFEALAPAVMPYIKKAAAAFRTILKDPIGFVGNLVRAGKLGFELFAKNVLEHLKNALIKWLTGPLGAAGVYIPKSFTLIEIVKLVLSVLGLTWQNIRTKLLKIIPEPVLVGLEKTAGVLVTLVKDGPAAAWEQIKTELSELKDQLIAQVTQMVTTEVVKAAVVKLVSMLNPAGAVVQAIIAIYNTVTFFIQKINQIAAVVASFIDSISAIASGQVDNAAKKVEQTMANTLVVIIGFLAKFAGVGDIPDKLVGVVRKIRQPIDKGLDKIVAWLGKLLEKAKAAGREAVGGLIEWWRGSRKSFQTRDNESHSIFFERIGNAVGLMVASEKKQVATFFTEKEGELNKAEPAPADKTAKLAALNAARNLYISQINPLRAQIDVVNNSRDPDAVKQTRLRALQTQLDPFLQQLANQLVILGVGTNNVEVVPTKIQPNGVSGSPKSMLADPLTKHGEPGSRPAADPPGWKEHIETIPNYKDYYVRLHLLSERLHGKGVVGNLTPGRKSENTLMEGNAESPAVRLVEGGHVLWYESFITKYRNTTYPGDSNIYNYFAEAITIRYGFKEKSSPTQWIRRAKSFEQIFRVDEPDPKGSRDPIPSLDTMSTTWVNRNATIVGLPRNAMIRIVIGRLSRGGQKYLTMQNFWGSNEVKAELASDASLRTKIDNAIANGKLKGLP